MTIARAATTLGVLLVVSIFSSGAALAQQSAGGLFPSPFLVEHAVTITEPDGGSFTGEPVVDHYGASMIVSVRTDGSRLIVDFARREITEIRPASGTYTVIGFDRMAQLSREYQRLEGPPPEPERDDDAPPTELRVAELAPEAAPKLATGAALGRAANKSLNRPRIRRLEVVVVDEGDVAEQPVTEVWLDGDLRLGPTALDAVEDFELAVLGATASDDDLVPLKALAAARRFAGGAVPVATARSARGGDGRIEDVALRAEPLDVFPMDLVAVPEGLQRAAHPLELMVAHAEQEAELRRLMGGEAER